MNEEDLRALIESRPTEANINEYGRFDKIKESLDKEKVRAFCEKKQGRKLMPYEISIESDRLLRKIVLEHQTGILNSILPKEGE